MPAAASSLRRLSSRLNSASDSVIAVRLLHSFRRSLSQIDGQSGKPASDPIRWFSDVGRRVVQGLVHLGPVRVGSIRSKWGYRLRARPRWTSAAGQVRLEQCRWRYFMPFAPNRQTWEAFGICLWGSGIPDESRTDTLVCLDYAALRVALFPMPDESLGGWSRIWRGVNWGPDGFRRSDS